MELSNGDLISAMDDPVEQAVDQTETVEQAQQRDDQGRFASKAEEAQQQEVNDQKGFVPSGRLREERELREAAERRYQDSQTQWERRFAEIQSRLPKPEQPAAPDIFENPNGFLEQGVKQHVDPIKSEIGQLREFYSQKAAVQEHGKDKVQAAYQWIAEGMQQRDPARTAIYQRAMSSMDPYGEIVGEHLKSAVFSQIGNDPNAWFGKELETKLSDPKFAAEIMQKIQGSLQGQDPQSQGNLIKMPPKGFSRASGAMSGSEESGDMSNAALMASALR